MTSTKTQKRKGRKSSARARADRAQKIADLTTMVADRAEELATDEGWQQMLTLSANGLWRYSFRNQLLITLQAQAKGITPTHVAGFSAWKEYGRHVRKGEAGLAILAPAGTFLVDLDDSEAPTDGRIVELEDGTLKREVKRFKVTYVWDIAQTDPTEDGEPSETAAPDRPFRSLDELAVQHLGLDALSGKLAAHVDSLGYRLSYEQITDGSEAFTSPAQRRVVVGTHLDRLGQVSALAHEIAHIELGHAEPSYGYHGEGCNWAEIEAESVAYVLLGACGVDATDTSIRYVASWAGYDLDAIRAAAEKVKRAARRALEAILKPGGDQGPDAESASHR